MYVTKARAEGRECVRVIAIKILACLLNNKGIEKTVTVLPAPVRAIAIISLHLSGSSDYRTDLKQVL